MHINTHHLSYCTNVHPSETVEELFTILDQEIPPIKAALCPRQPFGLGLRVGATVCRQLILNQSTVLNQLLAKLDERNLYVYTINAFPYGSFSAQRIKEQVYSPNWCTDARLEYTLNIATLLSLLPGPQKRSISTVAGGFQPETLSIEDAQKMSNQLRKLCQGLAQIEDKTGIRIQVGLEPEPWTTLEKSTEVIDFFERWIWPSTSLAPDYLGMCYDTCHQAIAFEDPINSWSRLHEAQIPIVKVQLSNALILNQPESEIGRTRLQQFSEPRFLHQVTGRQVDGTILRALDLPDIASPPKEWIDCEEWRCHMHVPLWWDGDQYIKTTSAYWRSIASLCSTQEHLHIETETYSWSVLPPSHPGRTAGLTACLIKELQVAQDALTNHTNPSIKNSSQ